MKRGKELINVGLGINLGWCRGAQGERRICRIAVGICAGYRERNKLRWEVWEQDKELEVKFGVTL